MADSSRISTCSQGFLQEYQLNINFIDTLRQQSDKVPNPIILDLTDACSYYPA